MPDLSRAYENIADDVYNESPKSRLRTADRCVQKIIRYKKHGHLLDIGCATGIFLDAASRYFDVEGIELSRWAGSEASKSHTVFDKPLSELSLEAKYDVVTLFGVIEHFSDPAGELKLVYSALKEDGLLVLYTPDVSGWLPRFLGKRWWHIMGMHLYYFSASTLRAMLETVGFTDVVVERHTTYFELSSLGRSLCRYKVGRLLNPVFNISGIRNILIPLTLSGEMLVFAKRPASETKLDE
jgi:SAM-dependent methyltransferase